jgi:hypothetical protein
LAGTLYWAISNCKQFGWTNVLGYILLKTAWLEHCVGLYLIANSLAGTLYWTTPYRKQLGWNTVLDYTLPQTAWLEHYLGLALLRTAKLLKDSKSPQYRQVGTGLTLPQQLDKQMV